MNKEVLDYIKEVRRQTEKLNLNPDEVFLNGNCGNLYQLLSQEFSRRHRVTPVLISHRDEPMHMVTDIDGVLYDITGVTTLEKYVQFLRDHSGPLYKEADFTVKPLVEPSERGYYTSRMVDMYRYNEDYEQSETELEMHKLVKKMKDYSQER